MNSFELAKALMACPSVTPDDAGCQQIIANYLAEVGFTIEHYPFEDVSNLWAYHGSEQPLLMLLGHTDVVPVGDKQAWSSDPFMPTEKEGYLYGRGACDMKVSLAAMIVAAKDFVIKNPQHKSKIGVLVTSDEEGPAVNGVQRVMREVFADKQQIDYCLVGEPTSVQKLGDTIKNGRRGSLSATLTILGKQGHIAYPDLADNPIHKALAALDEIISVEWDKGYNNFPPSSLQISNINAGTGAGNVIPQNMQVQFNIRFSPAVTAQHIKDKVLATLDKFKVIYEIAWSLSAQPFASPAGKLSESSISAIEKVLGYKPELSTSGGTSDARFVAPLCAEIIELGLLNATAHQVDERIEVAHIEQITQIYKEIISDVLTVK